jgi:hypothetical protein
MEIRNAARICDAGFVQVREWMLYKIREDHYPLNLLLTFELDHFERSLFQRTIDLLVERHEILRTTLQVIDGCLKQVIHDHDVYRVTFDHFDISDMESSGREQFIRDRHLLLSYMPFNFEFGPLFRVAVLRTGATTYEVCWCFHHVVIDSYSAGIFKGDAFRIWNGLLRSNGQEPFNPPVQYSRYTAFENELLDGKPGAEHRKYWKEQLTKGVPRLLLIERPVWEEYYRAHAQKVREVKRRLDKLPFHDARFVSSVVRRYSYNRAGAVYFRFSDSTFDRIAAFSAKYSSSPLALFLSGFLIALRNLSGQTLFAFDIPAGRRTDGIYKDMIGWLASGGICYFDMEQHKTTAALLDYIDRQLFHLSRHCIYPFEVLDYQAEIPAGSTMPVFFTLSKFQHSRGGNSPDAGIWHEKESVGICQDMDINVNMYSDSCSITLRYNNFLLSADTAEKLIFEQERCLNVILQDLLHS